MKKIAFADEFGNNSFDFTKQGTHFIVCSIIVNEHDLGLLEIQVEDIRRKFFQTGETKSKGVGANTKRRELILRELCKLDLQIFAVVVDKEKLYSEGFKHKSSFYKFMNGLVYKELYKTFPNLALSVDEHGSNDYMLSFKKYVARNHIGNLFDGANFEIQDSKQQKLIQVADFFAGTLGHCFDNSKRSEASEKFLEIINPKLSAIIQFPNYGYTPNTSDESNAEFDSRIAEISLRAAHSFVETKRVDDQISADQVSFVRLLILYRKTYNKRGFISTIELINHLQAGRDKKISEQYFRTKIVASVRDAGVLVASNSAGSRKGYKLPTSASDLYKFLNHSNSVVIPMLKRVQRATESIKLATNNELDLLAKEEYSKLNNAIKGLHDS